MNDITCENEMIYMRVHYVNIFDALEHAGTLEAAGDIEIDQLRRRLVETEAAMERIVVQMGNLTRGHSSSPQPENKDDKSRQDSSCEDETLDETLTTLKVLGMEMTASSEDGQKCSRPTTPVIPTSPSHMERERTPPKPIYLEGALPSQCELLVTDSETLTVQEDEYSEAPIVLSGKMTLSLINLEQQESENNENYSIKEKTEGKELDKDECKQNFDQITEKCNAQNHVKEIEDANDEQFSDSYEDENEIEQQAWSNDDEKYSDKEPLEE